MTENTPPPGAIGALLLKLVPGILGSLIALRFLPADARWLDKLAAFGGGFGSSLYVAPALVEWVGTSSIKIEAGVGFACGLFGMAVIGEVARIVREATITSVVIDWVRKFFGIQKG